MACFAAELVQPTCNRSVWDDDNMSPVGKIHVVLLDMVGSSSQIT